MLLKFTKNDLSVVLLLTLMKFGVGFIGSMVIPIFPSLIRIYFNDSDLSLSNNTTKYNYQQLSILFVTKNLCQIISSPIVGSLVDIFGAMNLLLGGAIFQLSTLLMYGLANRYYLLILGRVFEAISATAINCAGAAWVAYRFKNHSQRGFVYGVKALSYCIGSAIGPAYGGFVYEYFGKAIVFLSFIFFIIIEFFMAICLLCLDRETKNPTNGNISKILKVENDNIDFKEKVLTIPLIEMEKNDEKSRNPLSSLERKEKPKELKKKNNLLYNVTFFKDLYFLISVGTFPVVFISIYLLNSSLSRYMVLRFHATESQQGVVWLVNLLGYGLGFISGNVINTTLSTQRPLILMLYTGLHAIAVASIAFMPTWWSVSIPLCIIVHVHLVEEVVLSPILATIVETRHQSRFGVMSGIIMMSTALTGSLGSFLGPILLSTIGFMYMNIGVSVINIFYAPLYLFLKKFSQGKNIK